MMNTTPVLQQNGIVSESHPILKKVETTQKKIIYKEIVDEDDLIEMFALRSLVYQYVDFFSSSENEDNSNGYLDIDCYDPYSTFLGAFEQTEKGKRLVGAVRIISGDTESPLAPLVKDIYNSACEDSSMKLIDRTKWFPHLETFEIPDSYYTGLISEDYSGNVKKYQSFEKPYEISRLAVLPEYWKTKDRVEMGLHIMIILSSWKSIPNKRRFIIAVHPKTKRLYERLGFIAVPGIEEKLFKGINKPAIVMVLDLQEYLKKNNPYIQICKNVFDDYIKKGYYTRQE